MVKHDFDQSLREPRAAQAGGDIHAAEFPLAAAEGFGVSYRPRALLEVAQVHHVGYVRDVQGSDQAPERSDVLQALRLTDRWALLHERTQIEVQLTM